MLHVACCMLERGGEISVIHAVVSIYQPILMFDGCSIFYVRGRRWCGGFGGGVEYADTLLKTQTVLLYLRETIDTERLGQSHKTTNKKKLKTPATKANPLLRVFINVLITILARLTHEKTPPRVEEVRTHRLNCATMSYFLIRPVLGLCMAMMDSVIQCEWSPLIWQSHHHHHHHHHHHRHHQYHNRHNTNHVSFLQTP